MTSFTTKEVTGMETLGDKLRQLREELTLSIQDIAEATGIQAKYLTALEAGQYDQLPGEVYVRSFLKRYADVLHVSHARVYDLYDQERTVVRPAEPTNVRPPKALSEPHAPDLQRLLRRIGVVGALLVLLAYLGIKVHTSITPPALALTSPAQDVVTRESSIRIAGHTEAESKVRINRQEVFTDTSGNFAETVDLQPGLNVIKIAAQKQHSKEQAVYRRIVVEHPTAATPTGDGNS